MKTKQYKPQTGLYRIKPRDNFRKYGTQKCLIGISVGQEYHEGDKLQSMIDWAKERYDNVEILLADTLQKHNFIFLDGINEDMALEKSLKNGDEWIKRNNRALGNLKINRWDELYKEARNEGLIVSVHDTYKKNDEFADEIDNTIRKFFERNSLNRKDLYNKKSFELFYETSKDYLLEETAVDSYINLFIKAPVIYPGDFSTKAIVTENGDIAQNFQFIKVSILKNKKAA